MKSGLEGRNNVAPNQAPPFRERSLNEVRPRRPEQCETVSSVVAFDVVVSMKSGLEGRNNTCICQFLTCRAIVSMKSGLEGRNNYAAGFRGVCDMDRLNEVRPRRPEQYSGVGGLSQMASGSQ